MAVECIYKYMFNAFEMSLLSLFSAKFNKLKARVPVTEKKQPRPLISAGGEGAEGG